MSCKLELRRAPGVVAVSCYNSRGSPRPRAKARFSSNSLLFSLEVVDLDVIFVNSSRSIALYSASSSSVNVSVFAMTGTIANSSLHVSKSGGRSPESGAAI